ncbi:MAG TPA: cysteine desulfurase family protein [Candidatus Baltobacteraceae bacterium]
MYLDYAATTPLRKEAADAMSLALSEGPFNPSSLHAEGRRARAVLDDARDRVARVLGVARKGITFTGSGSEADNLAIVGAARAAARRGRGRHVVASTIEHHAVLHALDSLAENGFDVTLVPVDERGVVATQAFEAALRDDTVVASVMYANNEIGTIQPVEQLAAIARSRGAFFHTDAIQTPLWLPVDVQTLRVDAISLSAHKFYGPKGVGVLATGDGVAIEPLVYGGGQEFGRRSGTENVGGIAGLMRALELAEAERTPTRVRVEALRDRLERGILETVPDVRVNGADAPRLPNVLNASFAGIASDELLVRLDLDGVAVSAGSACTSGVLEPSHVIAALGTGVAWRSGAIRFSLGIGTTDAEIDRALEAVAAGVANLRRVRARA